MQLLLYCTAWLDKYFGVSFHACMRGQKERMHERSFFAYFPATITVIAFTYTTTI
jgi:hypothetical protein